MAVWSLSMAKPPLMYRHDRWKNCTDIVSGRTFFGNQLSGPEFFRRRRYYGGMLDEQDLIIVQALQEDARGTFADIGRRAGLSTSSVHERVKKLEQSGAIRGYRAVIDPEAVGLFVTALVSATPLDPTQPDDVPERVLELPEVEACHSVAGEESYILKVRTRTTTDLEDFLRRLREKAGVRTRTTIVLSTPFEHRPIAS
jgi:Lrp/AsnC family transcriptional regulator, leucine-responsive regulatory protein